MKKYTLAEASAFLGVDIFELVHLAYVGRVSPVSTLSEQKQVYFSEEPLLAYKGYSPLSQAAAELREKMKFTAHPIPKKEKLREALADYIKANNLENLLIEDRIYLPRKTIASLGRRDWYAPEEKKDTAKSGKENLPPPKPVKYYTRKEAVAYFRRKAEEMGHTHFSGHFEEYMLEHLRSYLSPALHSSRALPAACIEQAAESYIKKLYDPRVSVDLSAAASIFLQRAGEEKVRLPLIKETPYSQFYIKQYLSVKAKEGKLPAQEALDPADSRTKWFVKKEGLDAFIAQYVQQEKTKEAKRIAKVQKVAAYKRMIHLIQELRKGVEQQFGVKLPEKIFFSKPEGVYASIRYDRDDKYSAEENYGSAA